VTTNLKHLPPTESVSSANERPTTAQDKFEALWRDHHRALVGAVRAKVGSLQIAEDIAGEAYDRLRKRLDEVGHDTIDDLPGYFFKVAFNLAIDHFRHRAVVVEKLGLLQHSYHGNPTPEQIHMSEAALAQLERAVQQLPPLCREALRHVWLMEKTAEEASRDLGVPPTTVRGRVERAFKQLKDILTGDECK